MKNTATITQTNRPRAVLKLALALVLALTLIPFMPGNVSEAEAVELQEGVGQVTIGLDGTTLTNTTKVGFGGKEWVMIGYNGTGVASDANTMTLLLASGQIYTSSEFDSTNTSNAYSTSTLKTAMEGLVPTGLENDLIIPRTLAGGSGNYETPEYLPDNIAGTEVTGAKLWPLSVYEANQLDKTVRAFSDFWWLRSPGLDTDYATIVGTLDNVDAGGYPVHGDYAVRPAFKLNLESVLFTSAASGASTKNSAAAGSTLTGADPLDPATPVKLTVKDANLSLTNDAVTSVSGSDITFDYTASATSPSTFNRLSAIVQASDGTVKYYGNLADSPTGTGSATVTVPTGLAAGDKLLVFIEQVNGDNLTDFASEPAQIAFADQAAPTTPAGGINEITGVTPDMEYRATGATGNWTAITGTSVSGLAAGSYEVRLAGKVDSNTAYLASPAKTVTVTAAAPTPTPADPSKLAKTGDSTSLVLPVVLGVVALAALGAGVALRAKKRRDVSCQ